MGRRNRRSTIDLTECVCYHVISRCTRQLHLFGGTDDERGVRKDVLMRHLERVATASAVGVAGWSVMDNHLHLVLKVDTEVARSWSDREVARRWLVLHPPRDGYRRKVALEARHIDAVLNAAPEGVANARRVLVDGLREKLCSISHFMKEFKQEVTQDLNRLDETVGSVWAGRFKCQRIVDEAQLLTTLAYVDLNPFAAGVCDTPEEAEHTSLAARLGREESDAKPTAAARRKRKTDLRERRGWWMTVGGGQPGAAQPRRAVMPGTTLTFGRYLLLLDRVARLLRKGKRRLAVDTKPIASRLAVTPGGVAATVSEWMEKGLPWERRRVVPRG